MLSGCAGTYSIASLRGRTARPWQLSSKSDTNYSAPFTAVAAAAALAAQAGNFATHTGSSAQVSIVSPKILWHCDSSSPAARLKSPRYNWHQSEAGTATDFAASMANSPLINQKTPKAHAWVGSDVPPATQYHAHDFDWQELRDDPGRGRSGDNMLYLLVIKSMLTSVMAR